MKLLLPYFILIYILVQLFLRRNSKKQNEHINLFWQRESEANRVRKKDISNLDYIEIPSLPYMETSNPEVDAAQELIQSLKDKKILNLTGLSNTDLKMMYGAANLTLLTEYDNNFIKLSRAVAKAGSEFVKMGHETEGIAFLEFGISINTDISSNYVDLATYYANHGQKDKIKNLITRAELLKSMMKDTIVQKLQDIYEQ